MKISKFNVFYCKNGRNIIYNTFSGGIILLDDSEYNIFKNLEISNEVEVYKNHRNLIDNLLNGGFIEKKAGKQMNKLKFESYNSRFSPNNLSLTIAPTTDCNFRCPYCYEKGISHNTMTTEIADRVISFINSKNSKYIDICWYGGEPLLAVDIIEYISKGISKENVLIKHSMVTNGYLLNEKILNKLKKIGLNKIQITLDGPAEIHDKRRFYKDGTGTFDVITTNILHSCNDLNISIRINVDKTNVNYIDSLISFFISRDIFDKVHVYLAPVDDINETLENSNNILYGKNDNDDFVYIQKKFLEKTLSHDEMIMFFEDRNPYLCGAVSPYSFVIDSIGDLYKCWNDIGRKEYIVGNIYDGIFENSDISMWLGYSPFEDEECVQCNIFPICLAGCPHSILRKNKKICNSNKKNYKQLLSNL